MITSQIIWISDFTFSHETDSYCQICIRQSVKRLWVICGRAVWSLKVNTTWYSYSMLCNVQVKYVNLTYVRAEIISCCFSESRNNRSGKKCLKSVYAVLHCVKLLAFIADILSCVLAWGIYVTYFMNSADVDCLCALYSLCLPFTIDPLCTNERVHVNMCVYVCIWLCVKWGGLLGCVYTCFPPIKPRWSKEQQEERFQLLVSCLKDQPKFRILNTCQKLSSPSGLPVYLKNNIFLVCVFVNVHFYLGL